MIQKVARNTGLAVVFGWFMFGGIGHFTSTSFFVSIMPTWVPFALHAPIVYISGVIEIALAALLLWPKYRPQAGLGLILVTIGVTPANIHMWLHPESFPDVPPALLSIRLIVQVLLLLLIWWATRPVGDKQA